MGMSSMHHTHTKTGQRKETCGQQSKSGIESCCRFFPSSKEGHKEKKFSPSLFLSSSSYFFFPPTKKKRWKKPLSFSADTRTQPPSFFSSQKEEACLEKGPLKRTPNLCCSYLLGLNATRDAFAFQSLAKYDKE